MVRTQTKALAKESARERELGAKPRNKLNMGSGGNKEEGTNDPQVSDSCHRVIPRKRTLGGDVDLGMMMMIDDDNL